MFDIGWSELVVIGIVALVAIGPKELPGVLRAVGHWMGKIRRMANEFQGQFQEALREAEFADLQKQASDLKSSITDYNPLAETQKELEKTFETPDPFAEPATSAEATRPASAAEALGAPTPAPEPSIEVPLPEPPPAVTEKDFAPAEPSPPAEPDKAPEKQAGSSA